MSIISKTSELVPSLSRAQLEGIFYLIINEKVNTSKNLIQVTNLPRETVTQVLVAMQGLLEKDTNFLRFKGELLPNIKEENPGPYDFTLFTFADPDVAAINPFLATFEQISKEIKPKAKREYDQFFATTESSFKKAQMAIKTGYAAGNRIMLLGDDDLVSIALAMLGKAPTKLTVLDIDEDLVNNLNDYFKLHNLDTYRAYRYDAQEPLPLQFSSGYDLVITDPPYTRRGVTLFLNRAIELLDPRIKARNSIHFYYGNSFKSPEKLLKIQEIIERSGLLITNKIENFAQYNGAESIGSASSLYMLRTTNVTRPIEEIIDSTSMYTFQEQGEEKFPYVDHVVIKATKINEKTLSSKAQMQKILGEICNFHKLKVVDQVVTKFKNGGLSFTYILANSNLVVHTWPELGAAHIDLITCEPIYRKNSLLKTISLQFDTQTVEVHHVN